MNSTCLVRAASSATSGSSGSSASSVRRSAAGCSRISAAIRVTGAAAVGITAAPGPRPRSSPRRRPPSRAAARTRAARPARSRGRRGRRRARPGRRCRRPRSGRGRAGRGCRRQPARGIDRGAQVDAGRDHVGDGRVQPQPGAGDRAVGPAGQAERVDRDLLAAEVVRPRRHAGGRDGVGDQHDPARRRREREPADRCGDVVQVGDQPAGQPRVGQALPDHPGFPVVQRAHGVEQVGDQPGAGVRGGLGLLGGGVAVPDADQHAGVDQAADRGQRTGPLGRQRVHPQQPGRGLDQRLDRLRGGVAQQRRVVRAVPGGRQERTLDVHAEHPGAAEVGGQRGRPAQARDEIRHRGGDERRHERGDAGLRQPGGHLGPAGRVGGDEVDPEAAVDLHVDQAGNQDAGREDHVRRYVTVRLSGSDTQITPSDTATHAGPSGTLSATTRGAPITCTGTSPGPEH